MKDFEDMDMREKANFATGQLIMSIGEGDFRGEVIRLLMTVSQDAYNRGMREGVRSVASNVAFAVYVGKVPPGAAKGVKETLKKDETLVEYYERTDPVPVGELYPK